MANFTDLYRKRGLWIAIVEIIPGGMHVQVNAKDDVRPSPTKATWHQPELNCPIEVGGIYAALQEFFDVKKNENPYHVLALKRLPDDRQSARSLSYSLYKHAVNSPLEARWDPVFWLQALNIGLVSPEEYANLIKPKVVVTTEPTKKTTLKF